MSAISENPEPVRTPSRRRWRLAVAGLVVAAASVVGVVTLVPQSSTPAFAVTPNADGSVTLVFNDTRTIDGPIKAQELTRALQKVGVPAIVLSMPLSKACAPGTTGTRQPTTFHFRVDAVSDGTPTVYPRYSIVINKADIPADDVLVFSVSQNSPDKPSDYVLVDLFRKPGPTCFVDPPDPARPVLPTPPTPLPSQASDGGTPTPLNSANTWKPSQRPSDPSQRPS